MVLALAAVVGLGTPAAAQVRSGFAANMSPAPKTQGGSMPGITLYGGYQLAIFEGETGNGFGFGLAKEVGASGKVTIEAELSFLWYDGFNVQGYQGGIGFKAWEKEGTSIRPRVITGIEHCCGEGFSSTDWAIEPGVVLDHQFQGVGIHVSYGLRMVTFEGEVDKENVLTFGISKRFGG
jgi:hypothetical protein